MLKRITLIIICILSLSLYGCSNKINQNDGIKRFYLTEKYYNKGEFITTNDLNNVKNESYILFVYNNYCNLPIPCEDIFKEFMAKYQIDFLSMPFEKFKDTSFYENVQYAPSIIIVKEGQIVSFLDANKDDDLEKYQNVNEFEKWLNNYVYFTKK